MNHPPDQPFDDPELKAALRRTLGRESAPAGLRDRVRAMTAAAKPGESQSGQVDDVPIPIRRGRSSLYRFAVAAVLVIGFGTLAYRIWDMNQPPKYEKAMVISDSLYTAMINTHEERLASPAGDDPAKTVAAAANLARQINRPVLAADLTADGWTFQGAGVRNVGSRPAAQLFFTKGNASLSVLSMPAAAAPDAKEGQQYDKPIAGHVIAGFVKGPGLFCLVGSSTDGSLTIDEVKRLLEKHKSELVGG